jgi:hypothetical protein
MSEVVFDFAQWKKDFYKTADDEQKQAFKDFLKSTLRNERMNICFTKADGTERWLHCSLHPELIPAEKLQKEEASTRKKSDEALAVWDIEKQDWRSFRYDSVKEFSYNLGDLHI